MSNTVRRINRARSKKTTEELEQDIAQCFAACKASFMEIGKIVDERTSDLNSRVLTLENELAALKREKAPESGIIVPRMRLN